MPFPCSVCKLEATDFSDVLKSADHVHVSYILVLVCSVILINITNEPPSQFFSVQILRKFFVLKMSQFWHITQL